MRVSARFVLARSVNRNNYTKSQMSSVCSHDTMLRDAKVRVEDKLNLS